MVFGRAHHDRGRREQLQRDRQPALWQTSWRGGLRSPVRPGTGDGRAGAELVLGAAADPRLVDVERNSAGGSSLAESLDEPTGCLAKGCLEVEDQSTPWFDLLLIDEASQVGVAQAAAYFLLLDGNANVVLAGDHRQLGPIYGFQVEDTEGGSSSASSPTCRTPTA